MITDGRAKLAPAEEAEPGEAGQRGQAGIEGDRVVQDEALALAVLGDQGQAAGDRIVRRARPVAPTVDRHPDLDVPARVAAVDALQHLRPARAHEPGDADD